MTKNENLRLCGGTFFTLLLEARKQLLGANEHYAGKKDGLTEYETLIGLARVIRSDLATPMPTEIKTIQGNASEYKKCKNAGGGYFPFGDKTALRVFDERVKNEYVDTSVSIKVNIERVLMPFAKMPKTNRRTDILPNMVAVFRIILYYKSVTKYRRTRHTFTKSNGLYAMS